MANAKRLPAPLAVPVLMWVLGLVLAQWLKPKPLLMVASALAVCFAAWLLPRFRYFLVLLLMILLGTLRFLSIPEDGSPLQRVLKERIQIRQEICFRINRVFSDKEPCYEIKLYSLAGKRQHDRLIYYAAQPLLPGYWYQGAAEIQALNQDPLLDIYPNRFSAKAWQLGKLKRLSSTGIEAWVSTLRLKLLQNLDVKLGEQAFWAKGLLLSDTQAKHEHLEYLSSSGLMHLIVVSGLHVWFIYLIVVSLLRVFLSRELAELVFLPLILLFALLNNLAPPITRSVIMIGCLVIARQIQRPLSGLQVMALSLWIITLFSPRQIFNVGLQLSYLSVGVMLYGLPRVYLFEPSRLPGNPLLSSLQKLWDGLLLSALVSLAIIPVLLYHFGRLTFNGIIGNVLGIPLSGVMLPLAFLVLFIPKHWLLAGWLKLAYEFVCQLWTDWLQFSAELPFKISGFYPSANLGWALAIGILWFFLLIRGRFRIALYSLLPLSLLISGLLFWPSGKAESGELFVFNAGVADCCLIRLKDGRTLMIDTGGLRTAHTAEKTLSATDLRSNSWMQAKLLPWLQRKGIRQIDALVISHLHADHCGGFPALASTLKLKNIFISSSATALPLWKEFGASGFLQGSRVFVVSDTISYRIGDSYLQFLHPDKNFSDFNDNNMSLVCRLDTGSQRMLFCGDIETEAEAYLAEKYPTQLRSQYLKIPHHGSRSSSSAAFLASVMPREAWLTVSNRNNFHFPHPETISRYHRQGIAIHSTAYGSLRKKIDISAEK